MRLPGTVLVRKPKGDQKVRKEEEEAQLLMWEVRSRTQWDRHPPCQMPSLAHWKEDPDGVQGQDKGQSW